LLNHHLIFLPFDLPDLNYQLMTCINLIASNTIWFSGSLTLTPESTVTLFGLMLCFTLVIIYAPWNIGYYYSTGSTSYGWIWLPIISTSSITSYRINIIHVWPAKVLLFFSTVFHWYYQLFFNIQSHQIPLV
jgi:hypothetical protein